MGDEAFRRAVYEKIIHPLQFALDDYQYFPSVGLEHLESSQSFPSEEIEYQFTLFDDKDARPEAYDCAGIDKVETFANLIYYRPGRADEWFDYLHQDVSPLLFERSTNEQISVKVALLDTGLDPSDAFIRRHLHRIKYRSFIPGDESDAVKNATDSNGHGTFCAALLPKVAKNADVYIGRVTVGGTLESPQYIVQVR